LAEEPECDAVDLHSLVAGLQGVSQLVEKERDEKEDRRRDRHPDVGTFGEAGVLRREDAVRERPGDQREDDQPAPVDPDPDACNPAELDVRLHVSV
jgi:hypothetical protein